MPEVVDSGEVLLYGHRFPVIGGVQRTLLEAFPEKLLFGDPTRDDERVVSAWNATDFSAGLGIEFGEFPQHDGRFFWGTLDTRFPRQLVLAPEVTKRGALTGVDCFVDYDFRLYAVRGTEVYRWDEGTQSFGASLHGLGAGVVDAVVFKDKLYLSCDGAPVEVYDGASWTTTTETVDWMTTFRGTLYGIRRDGTLVYTTDGTNWQPGPKLDQPPGSARQLLVYFNALGAPALYVLTNTGLYGFNDSDGTWDETAMTFPYHPKVGRAGIWQSALYIPVGASVYRYDTETVSVVGPDRDHGLPPELRGPIVAMVPAHGTLFALSSGTITPDDDTLDLIYIGSYSNQVFFSAKSQARGAVLGSTGTGWHILSIDPMAGAAITTAAVSSADDRYRLWFSSTSGTYSIDLPLTLHNPSRIPTTRFAERGTLVTPWFDANWPEITKLAIDARVNARDIREDDTIDLYIQWDDDARWEYIGSVESAGRTVFPLSAEEGGRPFYRMRFRLDLRRGADPTRSPVLQALSLRFIKRPNPVWAYQFSVDLSKPYKGRTVAQLQELLDEILTSETAGTLAYRASQDFFETVVIPARGQGPQLTGLDHRGRQDLSFIEIRRR